MADLEALAGKYETALAAHQDDPDDEKKRAAADKAARALQDAREQARVDEGRPAGLTAVVRTDEQE